MLVGYEANCAMRDAHERGEFGRELISRLANRHIKDYRAMLFSTRIKKAYRGYYSSYSNVSTYVPEGNARLAPSAWIRYRLNPWLKLEKVKIFHGLNDELPYHIGRDIKTVVTCYGMENHMPASLLDNVLWKKRMEYSFSAADVIVAVSEEVKHQIVEAGANEQKVVVIGVPGKPYEVTDDMVEQYYQLYQTLVGVKNEE